MRSTRKRLRPEAVSGNPEPPALRSVTRSAWGRGHQGARCGGATGGRPLPAERGGGPGPAHAAGGGRRAAGGGARRPEEGRLPLASRRDARRCGCKTARRAPADCSEVGVRGGALSSRPPPARPGRGLRRRRRRRGWARARGPPSAPLALPARHPHGYPHVSPRSRPTAPPPRHPALPHSPRSSLRGTLRSPHGHPSPLSGARLSTQQPLSHPGTPRTRIPPAQPPHSHPRSRPPAAP